ncbi:MAG: TonB-dependent receptor [Gemmatimonadaceae bacterium]|nr:TonB-dependent receptor [Gemmatimonadaceae bacterium]
MTRSILLVIFASTLGGVALAQAPVPQVLVGQVLSAGQPVVGATVAVDGDARRAVRTDSAGRYRLTIPAVASVRVLARAIGYAPESRTVVVSRAGVDTLDFVLRASASTLNTVVTTATMQERYLSDSPVKVELVTPAFLQRNVSNNVMDNVSFLPGLTQQVDCGVCFTNNIRINGMEGPYTAVLIDGTPMMSALATVYGLNSIDPSLIEQIEIIRGPNSTLYGSEAMGGVINIVTKDARLAPKLSVNAFGTSDGESTLSLAAAPRIGSAQSLLSVSGSYNARFIDRNGDGFSDLPLVSRLSVMNKWVTGTPANRPFELMARVYGEDRFGGTDAWTREDRGSSTVYGESIRTYRAELLGTWRPAAPGTPLRLDLSGNWHRQNSYYGDALYRASQQVAFAQGVWSPLVGRHGLTFGTSLRYQRYADSTRAQQTRDARFIPGVFAQDEVALGRRVTMLGGLRVDHHRVHGVIPSPRLAVKWTPDAHTTVRVNGATGFRVVSLFTEDHAALTGARDVVIDEALQPERSATVTLSLNRVMDVRGVEDAMTLDLDLFHTRFGNRIVGDFDSDPNLIVYRNLRGAAITRGASLALGYATLRQPFSGSVGVTVQDVFVRDGGVRRALPFAASRQAVFALGYRIDRLGVTVDWTGRLQGPTPLPQFDGLSSRSPWFTEQHLQFTRRKAGAPDLYVAVKNLFNFVQRDAIIDPFNPFGDRFDTARVYGPLQGRRLLFGVRQTVGR